jgi:hypothetical protein
MGDVMLYVIVGVIFLGSLIFAVAVERYQDRASKEMIEETKKLREKDRRGPDHVSPHNKKPYRKAS